MILSIILFFLEGSALYIQYEFHAQPCLICVQQRAVIALMIILSVFGMFFRNSKKCLIFIGGLILSIMSIMILAFKQIQMQISHQKVDVCSSETPFPSWFPLHKWIPGIFSPRGSCAEVNFDIHGYSLSQILLVIMFFILASLLFSFASKIKER